jgi:hypothetical protein
MIDPTLQSGPMAGYLQGVGIPALVRELARRGATGLLHVSRRNIQRVIQIDRGRFVFASSSDPDDRLGEQMLKTGKVTLHQLESALSEQSSGKRLGTILVDADVLTLEELDEVVCAQIRMIVFDLMTWPEGAYRFDEVELPTQEDIRLGLTNEQLLFQGVRQIRELKLIHRGVGAPRTVYGLCGDWSERLGGVEIDEAARALLDRLGEGRASVEALCHEVCCSNFEIHQTLWALKLIGAVETVERSRGLGEYEGSLADTSLTEILTRLEKEGQTGVLYVTRGPVERSIMFAAGRCVFATSNDPDDGLVSFLFRRGVISLRDREETTRRLLSNKRVGTILRELGAIDDADLQVMVRQQVGEVIYDTISWEDAEYVFVAGPLPHAEEITLHTRVGSLIAEGIRRVTSWTRLMKGCGGVDNPLCLTPRYLEILDSMDASVAEWEVCNALKSPQTPRRVCSMTELNDFRVCQILWTLKLLGAIEDSPVELDEAPPVDESDTEPQPLATENVNADMQPAPVEPARVIADTDTEEPEQDDSSSPEVSPRQQEVEQALRSLHPQEGEDEAPLTELCLSEIDDEVLSAVVEGDGEDADEEPQWDVSARVEEVILRFNAMHRVVYRAVRAEVGAGAANFVRSCCDRTTQDAQQALCGVELRSDGSWDIEGLKKAVVERQIDDPWPSYQSVLDQEFVSLQPHLGRTRADQLKQRIWEIEQTS